MTTIGATTRWVVQNSISCAGFSVRNLGVKRVGGTVPITYAWVDVDAAGRPVRVEAELDLAAIDTGNARRERDLAKPRLLDTTRFPTLVFHGGRGTAEGDEWVVPGVLEAHGRRVDVQLRAVRTDQTITATTSIDRTALGIRAPRFLIGRRIDIRIDATLTTDRS